MELERANAESGEAGVVGWISSNDVALLGVVIVVVLLLFAQANYLKEEENGKNLRAEIDTLNATNDTIRERLATTRGELGSREDEIDRVRAERAALQAKRTALELDLAREKTDHTQTQSTLEQLQLTREQLEARLAKVIDDVAALTKSLEAMTRTKDGLSAEKTALEAKLAEAIKQRDQLDLTLKKLAAASEEQLTEAGKKIEVNEKQLNELLTARNSLQAIVKALELQLTDAKNNLTNTQKQITELTQKRESLATLVQQLQATLAKTKVDSTATEEELQAALKMLETNTAERGELLARNLVLQRQLQEALTKATALQEQANAAKAQLIAAKEAEKKINQDLVGIRGGLKRVAILVDASGSMQKDDRWIVVRELVGGWLTHFDVDECVLIVFNADVKTYPSEGMIRVSGDAGDTNRQWLIEQLAREKPGGWTNTVAALSQAYAYENLDSILLFTDGNPSSATSAAYNEPHVKSIFTLVKQMAPRKIPINTIGFGDDAPELSTFLRQLARETGGTFLGR